MRFYSVLEGGVAKCFGPTIFTFEVPVINDRSLTHFAIWMQLICLLNMLVLL